MTWREDTGRPHEIVDITKTIASGMSPEDSGVADKFKRSSGKTYGDFALPEAAPLVFPTLDTLDAADNEESKGFKASVAKKKNFVAEYFDKRGQAEFVSIQSPRQVRIRADFMTGAQEPRECLGQPTAKAGVHFAIRRSISPLEQWLRHFTGNWRTC